MLHVYVNVSVPYGERGMVYFILKSFLFQRLSMAPQKGKAVSFQNSDH